jgi:hypothetical protein
MRALTPAVEGARATANPLASMLAGAGALTAGPTGVIVGRFGFAEPATGQVSSARTTLTQRLGFVLPQWGTWQKLYCENGTWILRQGLMVTLASKGDFWCRFAGGAYPGQQVLASMLDGSATVTPSDWTADSAIVTADSAVYTADGLATEATPWTVVTPACPGSLAIISSWQPPYLN